MWGANAARGGVRLRPLRRFATRSLEERSEIQRRLSGLSAIPGFAEPVIGAGHFEPDPLAPSGSRLF
jgi:hypothetical protein